MQLHLYTLNIVPAVPLVLKAIVPVQAFHDTASGSLAIWPISLWPRIVLFDNFCWRDDHHAVLLVLPRAAGVYPAIVAVWWGGYP